MRGGARPASPSHLLCIHPASPTMAPCRPPAHLGALPPPRPIGARPTGPYQTRTPPKTPPPEPPPPPPVGACPPPRPRGARPTGLYQARAPANPPPADPAPAASCLWPDAPGPTPWSGTVFFERALQWAAS